MRKNHLKSICHTHRPLPKFTGYIYNACQLYLNICGIMVECPISNHFYFFFSNCHHIAYSIRKIHIIFSFFSCLPVLFAPMPIEMLSSQNSTPVWFSLPFFCIFYCFSFFTFLLYQHPLLMIILPSFFSCLFLHTYLQKFWKQSDEYKAIGSEQLMHVFIA